MITLGISITFLTITGTGRSDICSTTRCWTRASAKTLSTSIAEMTEMKKVRPLSTKQTLGIPMPERMKSLVTTSPRTKLTSITGNAVRDVVSKALAAPPCSPRARRCATGP